MNFGVKIMEYNSKSLGLGKTMWLSSISTFKYLPYYFIGISDFPSWMLGGTLAGSKKQLDQCKDDLDERETKSVCAFVSSSLSHTSLTSLSPSTDDVTSAGDADGNSNGKKPHRFGATNTNKNRSTRKHRCTYRCQHCHHLELMQQPWPFDTVYYCLYSAHLLTYKNNLNTLK